MNIKEKFNNIKDNISVGVTIVTTGGLCRSFFVATNRKNRNDTYIVNAPTAWHVIRLMEEFGNEFEILFNPKFQKIIYTIRYMLDMDNVRDGYLKNIQFEDIEIFVESGVYYKKIYDNEEFKETLLFCFNRIKENRTLYGG